MLSTIKLKNQIFALISIILLFACMSNKEIAINDEYSIQTRLDAIEKITDQAFLIEIFKNEKERNIVRKTALEGITNQAFLIEIFKNDRNYFFRSAAVEGIIDQAILTGIVKNEKEDNSVRRSAVKGIIDQDFLYEIAKSSKEKNHFLFRNINGFCKYAIWNMTNLENLVILAQTHPEHRVKLEAATRIQVILDPNYSYKYYKYGANINQDMKELMLNLLHPLVFNHYGLLKLYFRTTTRHKKYTQHGLPDNRDFYVVTIIDYFIIIENLNGKRILERNFVFVPQGKEGFKGFEKTKTRKAKIDYDEIQKQLLNQ